MKRLLFIICTLFSMTSCLIEDIDEPNEESTTVCAAIENSIPSDTLYVFRMDKRLYLCDKDKQIMFKMYDNGFKTELPHGLYTMFIYILLLFLVMTILACLYK